MWLKYVLKGQNLIFGKKYKVKFEDEGILYPTSTDIFFRCSNCETTVLMARYEELAEIEKPTMFCTNCVILRVAEEL